MSSSSLRQHQRKSAVVATGHTPLARNHSLGAATHHHSSSTSFATERSYRSLPSPATTASTITTTTTNANILHEDDDNNQLNEKNSNNIFNFDQQLNHFYDSAINQTTNEMNIPRSTRHLCGSIIPLQSSSTSSPTIDRHSTENDQLTSPIFSPLPFQKSDLKYRSHIFSSYFYLRKKNIHIIHFCFFLFRNLGRNGLRVSQLGLGTWVTFGGQISDDVAEELVTVAYDSGINVFDTAEVYAAGK